MSVPSDVVLINQLAGCCAQSFYTKHNGFDKLISFNGGCRKSTDPITLQSYLENGGIPQGLGFNEYQEKAAETAIYPKDLGLGLYYVALGLAGEAGEFAGEVSKLIRDDKGQLTPERAEKLKSEASDVIWYIAAVLTELNLNFEDVAQYNLDKLASRKERGVLSGSGGNR